MRKLSLHLVLLALLGNADMALGKIAGDDPVPWPYSTQCPLHWQEMEGLWHVVDVLSLRDSFLFKIVRQDQSDLPTIEIKQYDGQMNLIASGSSQILSGKNFLRFSMLNSHDDSPRLTDSYTVFVSNYLPNEVSPYSCEEGPVLTILTIQDYPDKDCQKPPSLTHYIIKKEL